MESSHGANNAGWPPTSPHNPFGSRNLRASEETIGVVGKQFPPTLQSDVMSRCPTCIMVLSLILPVVFLFIAIGSNAAVDISLSGFEANPHESTSSHALVTAATQAWLGKLSGTTTLSSLVDTTKARSIITYRQELRFDVSLPDFSNWYYGTYLPSNPFSTANASSLYNLFSKDNMEFLKLMEAQVLTQYTYNDVCFVSNLLYGVKQTTTGTSCTPPTSTTQYFFPGRYSVPSGTSIVNWDFSGQGTYYQFPYSTVIKRFLANPNYRWYADKSFSNLNPVVKSARTQFTLATPIAGSHASTVQTVRNLVKNILVNVNNLQRYHPYIYFTFGGDQVEESIVDSALQSEYYKLGIMILIVFVLCYAHTRTVILSICIVLQLLLTYMASWGFYISAYDRSKTKSVAGVSQHDNDTKALPLLSTISLFLIVSFCLHGTLTIYDTFVHSGIMSTTGRRNNLSVSQRIAFTMRRASGGVTIANSVAIIVFAINTASAFQAVRDFSVMMIFALLFNVYFAWSLTPSYMLWHHYYFSRKRRVAQKQREVITEHAEEVRRNSAMRDLLQEIQCCLRPGEETYAGVASRLALQSQAEEARLRMFLELGPKALVSDAKRELDEMVALVRQNREQAARRNVEPTSRSVVGSSPESLVEHVDFNFDTFIDVNTLRESASGDTFVSDRLVPPNKIMHIPLPMTLRSAENLATATIVAGDVQREPLGNPNPPTAGRSSSSRADYQAIVKAIPPILSTDDLDNLFERWSVAATRLNIRNAHVSQSGLGSRISAMLAYVWCAAHDPYWVISEAVEGIPGVVNPVAQVAASIASRRRLTAESSGGQVPIEAMGEDDGRDNVAKRADAEYTNFFSKLRYRWAARETEERQYCFGMFGKRVHETREERDARILARASKQEGYGRMERFLTTFAAPFIDQWDVPILIVFAALFIVAIALASQVIGAGVPYTLMVDVSRATKYARMGNLYAQSGSCDFCGLYYQPYNSPKMATVSDLIICPLQNSNYVYQMNILRDQCNTCNGNNACVGCDGVPYSTKIVTSCGTCAADSSACQACYSTASCSYCYLRNLSSSNSSGGAGCASRCNSSTCLHGSCNPFTSACTCNSGPGFRYGGSDCSGCAAGYMGTGCANECVPPVTTPACNCNADTLQCTSCPVGTRGYDCSTSAFYCLHGTQNAGGTACICDPGWNDGNHCEYHQACTFRGALYNTSNSPINGCGCIGNWAGRNCTLCSCLNGGTCDSTGSCVCIGAFSGPQCQYCDLDCSKHGTCPSSPLPPALLNLRSCLARACTFAQQDAGVECAPCTGIAWSTTGACGSYVSQLACNSDVLCLWFGGQCVNITNPNAATAASNAACVCNGAWSGVHCGNCSGPSGSTCLYNGDVVACDGFTYTSGVGAPALDACGVCGGSSRNCLGCDGVPNSGKVFDACGVCGGDSTCLGSYAASPVSVKFFFDVSGATSPISTSPALSADLIAALYTACSQLQGFAISGVVLEPVTCSVSDYETYVASLSISTSTSSLFNFALAAGVLGTFGFSEYNASAPSLQLLYMSVSVNLPTLTNAANPAIFAAYTKMLSVANELQEIFRIRGLSVSVYQTSDSWSNAVAAAVSLQTLRFTSGVGVAVLFGILSAVFANIRLAFFATVGVVFVLCGTLGASYTQGWDIDAVTQICVAGVIAIAAEHLVHVIDGYQDFLQSTQSHMFALSTTKMRALRGALTRTGVSVVTSTVAVIAVSLMFVGSAIQPFRRAAQVMITVHILTFFTSLLFFGAALCAAGPTRLFRHWAVSVTLCCICGCCGGIALLIIYLAGGVVGPTGYRVP